MAYALISDLHSNLAALEAVFADIETQNVDTTYCLGDVVGYGPQPAECTDLVMKRVELTLKGNHDEALIHGAHCFGTHAKDAIAWTSKKIKPGLFAGPRARRRWKYLTELPLTHYVGTDMLVHGSPRDPTMEYLLPSDLHDTAKYKEVFDGFAHRLFCGHTHLPGVLTDRMKFYVARDLNNEWTFPDLCDGKAVINVGSVGQPRDDDPRACYAVVDGATVRWRRVEYDIATTVALIEKIDEIDARLGERLLEGK